MYEFNELKVDFIVHRCLYCNAQYVSFMFVVRGKRFILLITQLSIAIKPSNIHEPNNLHTLSSLAALYLPLRKQAYQRVGRRSVYIVMHDV